MNNAIVPQNTYKKKSQDNRRNRDQSSLDHAAKVRSTTIKVQKIVSITESCLKYMTQLIKELCKLDIAIGIDQLSNPPINPSETMNDHRQRNGDSLSGAILHYTILVEELLRDVFDHNRKSLLYKAYMRGYHNAMILEANDTVLQQESIIDFFRARDKVKNLISNVHVSCNIHKNVLHYKTMISDCMRSGYQALSDIVQNEKYIIALDSRKSLSSSNVWSLKDLGSSPNSKRSQNEDSIWSCIDSDCSNYCENNLDILSQLLEESGEEVNAEGDCRASNVTPLQCSSTLGINNNCMTSGLTPSAYSAGASNLSYVQRMGETTLLQGSPYGESNMGALSRPHSNSNPSLLEPAQRLTPSTYSAGASNLSHYSQGMGMLSRPHSNSNPSLLEPAQRVAPSAYSAGASNLSYVQRMGETTLLQGSPYGESNMGMLSRPHSNPNPSLLEPAQRVAPSAYSAGASNLSYVQRMGETTLLQGSPYGESNMGMLSRPHSNSNPSLLEPAQRLTPSTYSAGASNLSYSVQGMGETTFLQGSPYGESNMGMLSRPHSNSDPSLLEPAQRVAPSAYSAGASNLSYSVQGMGETTFLQGASELQVSEELRTHDYVGKLKKMPFYTRNVLRSTIRDDSAYSVRNPSKNKSRKKKLNNGQDSHLEANNLQDILIKRKNSIYALYVKYHYSMSIRIKDNAYLTSKILELLSNAFDHKNNINEQCLYDTLNGAVVQNRDSVYMLFDGLNTQQLKNEAGRQIQLQLKGCDYECQSVQNDIKTINALMTQIRKHSKRICVSDDHIRLIKMFVKRIESYIDMRNLACDGLINWQNAPADEKIGDLHEFLDKNCDMYQSKILAMHYQGDSVIAELDYAMEGIKTSQNCKKEQQDKESIMFELLRPSYEGNFMSAHSKN